MAILREGTAWVGEVSFQAGLLVLLICLLQGVLGSRLTPRWAYALWMIVVLRLLMPWAPPTPWSLFNFVRLEPIAGSWRSAPGPSTERGGSVRPEAPYDLRGASDGESAAVIRAHLAAESGRPIKVPAHTQGDSDVPRADPIQKGSAFPSLYVPQGQALRVIFGIWLSGFLVMMGRFVAANLYLSARIRQGVPVRSRRALKLMEQCRRHVGIRRAPRLVVTPAVNGPALYGVFHLKLLLPVGLIRDFSNAELRYVFLHELSHIKRRDVWINWITYILEAIHWFNPLLRLGFWRMRVDREPACDALALSYLGEGENTAYGLTMIKLLERIAGTRRLHGALGAVGERRCMERRIRLVAQYKRDAPQSRLGRPSVVLFALIALTDARSPGTEPVSKPPPTSHQTEGAIAQQWAPISSKEITDKHENRDHGKMPEQEGKE